MTVHLKFVETLDLSYCTLISDDGLDALTGNEGEGKFWIMIAELRPSLP